MGAPQPAAPLLQHVSPRGSLDVPRATPRLPSPARSGGGSIPISGGGEVDGLAGMPLRKEELLEKERVKADARAACVSFYHPSYDMIPCLGVYSYSLSTMSSGVKKSLVDLTNFTTTTTRRLDEAYYTVLQKLTTLQNTMVALRDLAQASKATSAGFIAESHSVLFATQAQLDAFGDFSEQQERVQALQDRVHGGRERIATLSQRVDIVKQRVERWERADREWQERTRRKLKIIWGVVLGSGLVILVLYLGARAYAPEIEGVVEELKEDVEVAKTPLGHSAVGVGLGKTTNGDGDGENKSLPELDFLSRGRDREAEMAGDDVIRALDEL